MHLRGGLSTSGGDRVYWCDGVGRRCVGLCSPGVSGVGRVIACDPPPVSLVRFWALGINAMNGADRWDLNCRKYKP